MLNLIGVLALVVSAQYVVIALVVVPRLAQLARSTGRAVSLARWGAAAFFIGCALTHVGIALTSFLPGSVLGMSHMSGTEDTSVQLIGMVVPHIAQIVGGMLFIGIFRSHLEVSILSRSSAQDQRALDRQWRSAFNEAPLGIALLPMPDSPHGGDAYVNPAYVTMFGPGDSDGGLAYPLAAAHPDEQAEAERAMSRIADGESVEQQLHVVGADGQTRLIRATLNPVAADGSDGRRMTGIFEDITEVAAAEAALRTRGELFRRLAEGLAVGVSLCDIEPPELIYTNSEYLEIVGLSAEASLHGAIADMMERIHPDDFPSFIGDYWAGVQRGELARAEIRLSLPDGGVRWLRIVSNPISANQAATTVEDITASKTADAAVRSAKAEAEKANLAKSEFLSRMSHELRTPLNAVLGFGQLLELGTLTPKQGVAVTHILGGGRHLLGMIDDILDISRIETDQLEMSLEPVRAGEVIAEAVALVRPMATDHHVAIDVTAPDGGTADVVRADRRRLRQVLINLLSNAVKYTHDGGTARITCAMSGDDHLAITVSDNGIGIRQEDLARLFTPFDRLGQQLTEIEGTGIGLALSHRLAAIMGGRLECSSTHGVGSAFTVVLPVSVAPQPDDVDVDLPPADAPATTTLTPSTLLYVEDNPPNVRLMQALVDRRPGWQMVHAGHGSTGWDLAASLVPALVLLDLHLPDMNGLELLRRLRADPRTAHLRVAVVSADANRHQVQRLLDAGADAYLTKPLDVAQTLALLDQDITERAPA